MAVEVLVPPLGQTVDTLVLVSWSKQEGEEVRQGEPLFSVETDKATLEVEAPASGVLREVTARSGDAVKVLSVIAVIAAAEEAMVKPRAEDKIRSASASASRLFVSPRARRLADAEGVPLSAVQATGLQGAIIERDVRAYLEEAHTRAKAESLPAISASTSTIASITPVARRMAEESGLDWQTIAGTGPRGQVTKEDIEAAAERRSQEAAQRKRGGEKTAVDLPASGVQSSVAHQQPMAASLPFSGIRGIIAERMVASHSHTAPVTLTAEADATALVALRKQLAADEISVSYNDLLLTVLARALREHPRLNAALDGEVIKVWPQMDIGLAVDTERGLLVPVVRGVDRKGLAQLASETVLLTERARAGKCTADELTGGTFTLTNLGMYGIDAFTPIINLPECAILGVGRIKTQPAWVSNHVEPRQMVWLSLTFDHRLVDGAPAARFLQRVVQLVEKPHLLMA